MRRLLLTALLVTGACEQRQPIPITYVPQAPTPTSAGTPEEQAARNLRRAMGQETRQDRFDQANPNAPALTGEPAPTPFEIGGGNPDPVMPDVGIPFNGI